MEKTPYHKVVNKNNSNVVDARTFRKHTIITSSKINLHGHRNITSNAGKFYGQVFFLIFVLLVLQFLNFCVYFVFLSHVNVGNIK